jgi:hypothetical protein
VAKKREKLKPGRWWDERTSGELHQRIFDSCEWLRDNDSARRTRFLRYARVYANRELGGLQPLDVAGDARKTTGRGRARTINGDSADPRLNVARNMVDSVQAKIAKNRPRATFLTEAGDFTLQQQARRLEQFCAGVSYKQELNKKAPIVFRDGAVFGPGVLKVWGEVASEDKKLGAVKCERVYPWELHVDPLEAYYGAPRSLFHTRLVDRGVLLEMFGDDEECRNAILAADVESLDNMPGRDLFAEQLLVVEAWHLPSGPDAKDGRHAIVIEDYTLETEEWTSERFPFAFFTWSEPLVGFWGDSLVGEVEGIQLEINELAMKIQKAMYHHATPKWMVRTGSNVKKTQIDNNEQGVFIEYAGDVKPEMYTHPTVHAEIMVREDKLYQRAYEIAGVSQLSAQSKKPAGLDSGVALAEYNDIESERFVIVGQAWEEFYLDVARLQIEAARQLHEAGYDVEVKAEDRRRRRSFLRKIKWSDVEMDDDAFQLKIFPASSLPQSPAGRKAAVEALFTANLISQPDALALLDFPDLDATLSRQLAPYELVLDQIESILDENHYIAPEPFQDLALCITISQQVYLRAKIDRVPEERLQMLRDFIDAAKGLEDAAKASAAPTPTPVTAAPVMDPMAAMAVQPAPAQVAA